MTTPFKLALAIVAMALIGYSLYVWVERQKDQNQNILGEFQSQPQEAPQPQSVEIKTVLQTAEEQMQETESQQTYRHPSLKFRFNFPQTMKVGSFEDAGGQTVLVQDAGNKLGMQIYISDFDEDTALTEERIKRDIPDMVVNQPVSVVLGGTKGVSFFSQSESLGQTYEVWLVRNKKLYQISAYAFQKQLVDRILGTWKWE
jgi:hypothetical protein